MSWAFSTKTNYAYVDGILGGTKWTVPVFTYGFPDATNDYVANLADYAYNVTQNGTTVSVNELNGFSALNAGLVAAAIRAMEEFEAFTLQDVDLRDTGLQTVNMRIATVAAANKRPGYAANPAYANPANDLKPGDIWFEQGRYPFAPIGSQGFLTAYHEIGHVLGLKHPHDDGGTVLPADRDSLDFTVMTYRSYVGSALNEGGWVQGHFPQTFMMYDIAALQHLYGADFGHNGTATRYTFDTVTGEASINGVGQGKAQSFDNLGTLSDAGVLFRTIWDGGGTDIYDFSNFTTRLSVDLRPEQYSDLDVGGFNLRAILKYVPTDLSQNRFALGHVYNALPYQGSGQSLIEHAIGGSNNDTMTGNWGNNRLEGRGGDDVLAGLAGIDTLIGGAGFDIADYSTTQYSVKVLLGPGGDGYAIADGGYEILRGIEGAIGGTFGDELTGNAAANFLAGGGSGDRLDGAAGDDSLQGDGGDDLLIGGDGADRLDGGTGRDTADYRDAPSAVYASLLAGKATGGWANGDTYLSIENLNGSAFADDLRGNDGANVISGYGGNDRIEGRAGNDTIYGDAGADTLVGEDGQDYLHGGTGHDFAVYRGNGLWLTADAGDGSDTLVSIEGIGGSAGNDTIFGNAGGNHLFGDAGDDQLYGGNGADTLQGGDGWDHHDGGEGPDLVSYRDRAEARKIDLGFDRGDGTFGKVSGGDSGDTFVSIEDVEGTRFDDTLIGNAGFNILYGLDGNDQLESSDGDALWGGLGDDSFFTSGLAYVYGEGGQDAVAFTGTGGAVGVNLANQSLNSVAAQYGRFFDIETFYGTAANDSLTGGAAAIAFHGLTGNDLLRGGTANDTLGGGAGADYLDGGAGFDVADYAGDTLGVLVDLRSAIYLYGEAAGDVLLQMEGVAGGAGNDSLGGTNAANRLLGRDGNDYLSAYAGADSLWGGAGNDSMEGGAGADLLDGGAGNDVLGDNEQVLLLFATDDPSADTLLGGGGADSLMALSGDDWLDGGPGADTMSGGVGDDTYVLDNAGDVVLDAGGIDTLRTPFATTLPGFLENLVLTGAAAVNGTGNGLANVILGNAGANLLTGGGGDDSLAGAEGADTLNGGAGADTMAGGLGDDRFNVDNALDRLIEQPGGGTDLVAATVTWTLGAELEDLRLLGTAALNGTGNAAGNRINGNDGNNRLWGLNGDDVLLGGAGADTLTGGAGADTLTGGAGADRFLFQAKTQGKDVITDFTPDADAIAILASAFSPLLQAGALPGANFVSQAGSGATAPSGTPQFVYDSATGLLLFDGDGMGGTAALELALLAGAPAIGSGDIVLV